MSIEIRRAAGADVAEYLEDAARLRISVFREFPYLYEGDEESEREYLGHYTECPGSVFVLAICDGRIAGVSTGLPLAEADPVFQKPFIDAALRPADWFYFGESVLDRAWRGKGIGHRFFDEREAHARGLGFTKTCFCSVKREPGHPLCPEGYRPNDLFWTKRGYVKQPELRANLAWKQIDATEEVENELVFWTRE